MNITRLNFRQTLPLVKAAIKDSHFLSFDLQMSGILTQELTTPSIVDSMQTRYEKQRQCVNKYIPLQFGLSTFRVLPEQNKIIACPFNFYIFPLTHSNEVMKFSFHAGTMTFLTKNNFDFNKLFYEGIPYTNKEKIQQFKKQQNINDLKRQLKRLRQMQSPDTKVFIALKLPVVQEWMKSELLSLEINVKFIKYQAYMNLKEQIEQLHPLQSLLFQFDSELIYKRTKMVIRKITQQEKLAATQQIDCQVEEEFMFNEVVEQMCNSKKSLIVHNGFLDLMHVYFRFFNNLPNEWQDYKKQLRNLFPRIYDNKYLFNYSPTLMSLTPSKFTSLGDCFTGMKAVDTSQANTKLPTVQIDPHFTEYNLDNLECHEAGFDALMTGYSFLKGVTTLNNDISLLTRARQFAQANRLIVNRIPQGSIKVPFNLQDKDEDIYTSGGNCPIFFKSVLCKEVKESVVQDYFSKHFGAVNFLWTSRDMTEFCIIFLDSKEQQAYRQHLEKTNNGASSIIVQIENVKYLVLSRQEHQQMMNNFIKNEQTQTLPTPAVVAPLND